jgi:transposase InsO family protein
VRFLERQIAAISESDVSAFELMFRHIHLHPALTIARAFWARRWDARVDLALALSTRRASGLGWDAQSIRVCVFKFREASSDALARDLGDARSSIGRYIEFYNTKRPHSSLDRRTPNEACFHRTPQLEAHLAAAEIFRRALDVT